MYGDDGPDDDGSEHFIDAGWWTPDDVDELRDLLKMLDLTKPTPGSKTDAVLILMNDKINPPDFVTDVSTGLKHTPYEDPHVTWARKLLYPGCD